MNQVYKNLALFMVIGICLLGLLSNIAHFGSASAARTMPKSLQSAKPAVTSLDALASFQQQQAEDALKLQKEREAAERLLGNAGETLERYSRIMHRNTSILVGCAAVPMVMYSCGSRRLFSSYPPSF